MKKLMSALAILLAMMCASPGAMAQPSCKDGMGILFFQQARPIDVSRCLKAGADVNARDWAKSTPLHLALTRISRREIAPILLEAGADGNARDDWGKTPFEIIRRLINDLGWEWPKKYLEQSERK